MNHVGSNSAQNTGQSFQQETEKEQGDATHIYHQVCLGALPQKKQQQHLKSHQGVDVFVAIAGQEDSEKESGEKRKGATALNQQTCNGS